MYIPEEYRGNKDSVPEFIKRFPLGIVTSVNDNRISACHLPFVLEQEKGIYFLFSHIARLNEQWKSMENKEVLIIFSEPHAYISPEHYFKKESVPTWNYMAVHLYGTVKLQTSEEDVSSILRKSIRFFEKKYEAQWDLLSGTYKKKLMSEIIGLKVKVNEIQFCEKLSQEKSKGERKNISQALKNSNDPAAQTLSDYMLKQVDKE